MNGKFRYSLHGVLVVSTLVCVWLAQCHLLATASEKPTLAWVPKLLGPTNIIILLLAAVYYKRYKYMTLWIATSAVAIATMVASIVFTLAS
jgi:hypothetical protein